MARPRQIADVEILEATLNCMLSHEGNFSTRAVAEQIRISPQAVLKRMGSKRELLIRSFLYYAQKEVAKPFFGPLDQRPFRIQLREQGLKLTTYFHWIERFRALFISNGVAPSEVVSRFDTLPPLELLRQMDEFLESAREAGFIQARQLRQVSASFLGTLGYQCHMRHMFPMPELWGDEEIFVEHQSQLILDVLELEASRPGAELPFEIERKYLLSAMPSIPSDAIVSIQTLEQGYIPGRQITERVRRITRADSVRHLRTVKLGTGIERLEFEEEISADLFEHLWAATLDGRIRKERTIVKDGDACWEIDRFLDFPLWLAEIELESAEIHVQVPDWLKSVYVRDVTEEKNFTNWALATQSGGIQSLRERKS